uniref:7TM_GPCR_Srx domain-containing protein n=1 Tax=Rhabditophanes sp. KR3021 TaxID=114890 RepID=A0AC35UDB8_9BILA
MDIVYNNPPLINVTFYSCIMNTIGVIGFIVNIWAFLYMHLKPPKFMNEFVVIAKYTRLTDAFFIVGMSIIGQPIVVGSFPSFAINGLIKYINNENIIFSIAFLVILNFYYLPFTLILSFLSKYNVFCRKEPVFYTNKYEKMMYGTIYLIIPICGICSVHTFLLPEAENDLIIQKVSSIYLYVYFTFSLFQNNLKKRFGMEPGFFVMCVYIF